MANLDHIQTDDRLPTSLPDESGPEFFLYDMSWVDFCDGNLDPQVVFELSGVDIRDLSSLGEAYEEIFARHAPTAIAVKSQHAYQRTLAWEERTAGDAERALRRVLAGSADEADRICLGDWSWARGVEHAIAHELPFKIHTGYYSGAGTAMPMERISPGQLSPLLARYPEARFVLMHIAYPYDRELIAVAKHFPNVWVDLCWAWSIDPHTTAEFVRRFLHAVPINKLFAFGGDTFWPTGVVGYAAQSRNWLTVALAEEVNQGLITEREAMEIATRLMRENQFACFDVEGTRSAVRAALATAAL